MKIKYLSLAFAAVALASCSSDELPIANGTQPYDLPTDGSQVFVTVADSEDSNITRAGYAVQTSPSFAQKIVFEKDDAFKMYCKNIWMPQVYKFKQEAIVNGVNGDVFEWADASSKYNSEETEFADREYGVFPANMFQFDNENREHLVFSLPKENTYQAPTTSASTTQEGRTVYHALVPMFGYNVENNVTFHYMTSLVRVHVLGLPAGDHTLKLESQDLGTSTYYQLSGDFEAQLGDEDWDAAAVTNGDYTTAEGESIQLPEFKTKNTNDTNEKEVSIKFTTTASSDYYMYLPFPTGTYQDDKLTLKLDDVDISGQIAYFTAAKDNEDGTHTFKGGCMIKVELENPETKTVADLVGLNNLLEEVADFGRDVTVDVTVADDANIEVLTGSSYIDKAKKLIVPQLKNNVTLNIKRTTTGTLQETEGNIVLGTGAEKLEIVDAGEAGTGVLTICMASKDEISSEEKVNYVDAPIEINTKQSVVLKGQFKKAINVTTVKDIYFGDKDDAAVADAFAEAVTVTEATRNAIFSGAFGGNIKVDAAQEVAVATGSTVGGTADVFATGVVALDGAYTGAASVETAGNISLAGTYNAAVTAKTTADVELSGSAKMGITAEAANFTVAEGTERILGAASTVTATTTIVIKGQIKHRFNAKGAATVTVAEGATITGQPLVVYGSGAVSIEGNASKFIMANGSTGDVNITGTANSSITIQEGAEGKLTLNHAANIFAEVNVNGDATIDLKAGKVTTIAVAAQKTATIKTFGASEINEVTLNGTGDDKAVANIFATWDAKTEAASDYGKIEDTDYVTIYTAAQLAMLSGTAWSTNNLRLKADITVADGATANWIPVTWNGGTFDGNSKTITGLTIKPTATSQVGFFKTIKGETTVKDLTLAGLTFDGTATQQIGGLVGNINAASKNVTIEKVSVSGKKLYGTDEAFTIGGLIGRAQAGTIAIANSKVKFEEIAGKQYVGGLIGDNYTTGTAASITLTQNEDQTMVTLSKLTQTYPAGADHKATFGMLMGAIRVKATITIGTTAGRFDSENLIAGHRDSYEYDKKTYEQDGATFKFTGAEGNYVGFCPAYDYTSDSAKKTNNTGVTINGTTLKYNELNKFVLDNAWKK